jgi:hypothetical protein
MNTDDCRNKADECLAAAQYASDRDAQRTWRHLADMWLLWSEQLRMSSANNAGSAPSNELQDGTRSVASIGPARATAIADNAKAATMADRLRSRLSLAE